MFHTFDFALSLSGLFSTLLKYVVFSQKIRFMFVQRNPTNKHDNDTITIGCMHWNIYNTFDAGCWITKYDVAAQQKKKH